MNKFFKWKNETSAGLTYSAVLAIIAGLYLFLTPRDVSIYIVMTIGVLWILEGITYVIKITEIKDREKEEAEEEV